MSGRFVLGCLILVFLNLSSRAQVDLNDPLGSAFRISARDKVRQALKPGTSAVFFSGGFQRQSENVVEPRPFLAHPDFHYLTGLNFPDAVLVILKSPVALTEGQVSELLFLPGAQDQALKLMGYDFPGKFGLHSGTLALRPSSQWRKFCLDVLAPDEMMTVFANPVPEGDYQKRGILAYNDLGSIFFNSLAPGFPFDPTAQALYKEILRADTSALRLLRPRAEALLNYYPLLRRDPIVNAFSNCRTPGDLMAVQAQIKAIKIDVEGMQQVLRDARIQKGSVELSLLQQVSRWACEAMEFGCTGRISARTERQVQAAVEYYLNFKGASVPVQTRVAAGNNAMSTHYVRCNDSITPKGSVIVDVVAEWKHYFTRITRTFPSSGRFEGKDLELYSQVRSIHNKGIQACKPNTLPSHIVGEIQSDFEDAVKRLGITQSGTKGVSWIFDVTSTGLDLNEYGLPKNLLPGMVVVVETSVFIQAENNVKAEWKNKAVSLRDVVFITEQGPKSLTSGFTSDPGGLEAILAKSQKLPLEQ
jgi:Xaa-Pro aminopeptidase